MSKGWGKKGAVDVETKQNTIHIDEVGTKGGTEKNNNNKEMKEVIMEDMFDEKTLSITAGKRNKITKKG